MKHLLSLSLMALFAVSASAQDLHLPESQCHQWRFVNNKVNDLVNACLSLLQPLLVLAIARFNLRNF